MKPEHKGSHRADRNELLKSPPTFDELIKIIYSTPNLNKEEKAFFGIAIGTGARVSEICGVRFRDLTFRGHSNQEIPFSDILPSSCDVAKVQIRFNNLKNKNNKYKTGSIIRTERFLDVFTWIVERYREIGPEHMDDLMYTKGRKCAYWLTKRLGNNWFPHIFRHYFVSNLIRDGVSPAIVKQAAGWSSMDMLNSYLHLTTKELENELKKFYGDSVPVGVPNRPLSINQALGAVAAATQEKVIGFTTPKHQVRHYSVMNIDGTRRPIQLPKQAKVIRDKLKSEGIGLKKIIKVEKEPENDILQIV